MQRDLSRRQVYWQEFFAQYEFEIVYVQGEDNTVADALSRVEPSIADSAVVPVFAMTADSQLLDDIK